MGPTAHGAVGQHDETSRPSIVVDAVGHQVATIRDAVTVVDTAGHVYAFGIPDDPVYPLPMHLFLRKNAHLCSGTTLPPYWRAALTKAAGHLRSYPEIVKGYVTNSFSADEVNAVSRTAYAPKPDQLKVILKAW